MIQATCGQPATSPPIPQSARPLSPFHFPLSTSPVLHLAIGSPTTVLSNDDMRAALFSVLDRLPPHRRVIAVPPDYSRNASRAGDLTCMVHDYFGDRLTDVLPAVGTHEEMSAKHRHKMFPTVPDNLFRYHNWRT